MRGEVPVAVGRFDDGVLPLLAHALLVADAHARAALHFALVRSRVLPMTALEALYAGGRGPLLQFLGLLRVHHGGLHDSVCARVYVRQVLWCCVWHACVRTTLVWLVGAEKGRFRTGER